MRFSNPTWLIGCGNMAGAMVEGWRSAGVDFSPVVVVRPSGMPVQGVRTVSAASEAGPPPRLVILAVKPQKLDEVAAQLAPWLTSKTTLVSILAGVEAATLRDRFPKAGAIVRAMPNLPVAVRRGIVALYSGDVAEDVKSELTQLFLALGMTHWARSDAELAAAGSVAGAGPAYVARFIGALARAGEQRGLNPQVAATVALETVFGTAWMASASGEGMDSVARRVASPNGTTEAGLAVLDREGALEQLVGAAIAAAGRRGEELAAEARTPQVDSPPVLP